MSFSTYQYLRMVGQAMSTSLTTVATVPASTQYLIKDINITNNTASAINATVSVGGVLIVANISIPAQSTLHWTGLLVANAAETIQASASVATNVWLAISGQSGV